MLKRPRNLAMWALLTRMALELEIVQQNWGPDSPQHHMALLNIGAGTCGFEFIAKYGRPGSQLVGNYLWNGSLIPDTLNDLNVIVEYTHFLRVFPMWHKNYQEIDLLPDRTVRFNIPRNSPRQRQVIAYHQIFRPSVGEFEPTPPTRRDQHSSVKELFATLIRESRSASLDKLKYEPSSALIEALRPQYTERLVRLFRHSETLDLGGYSLRDFKSFYVAFLILCAIHEHVCYPWKEPGQIIPISSLVMVRKRASWIARLSEISMLTRDICERIVADLTLDPTPYKSLNMTVHPFVPLDATAHTLAVIPQFPLASAADENILRTYSYASPALFSASNTDKEATMRAEVLHANVRYRLEFAIDLPDHSTEIDLIIEDTNSSTAVLAELKWIRKPLKRLERIDRDGDVLKGIEQLKLIRDYSRREPEFLSARGKLTRSLASYANVYYLLLVRDHWLWVEPDDGIAIVDFQAFISSFRSRPDLYTSVSELIRYNWLPVEGRDFKVAFDLSAVNGALIESATFKPIIWRAAPESIPVIVIMTFSEAFARCLALTSLDSSAGGAACLRSQARLVSSIGSAIMHDENRPLRCMALRFEAEGTHRGEQLGSPKL
jgi:hypothetical protein